MQYQPMVRMLHRPFRHTFHQFVFDLSHGLTRRHARAIGDTKNVRIHRHHRFTVERVEHDIGCFAADTWQGLEFNARLWQFTVVLLKQCV